MVKSEVKKQQPVLYIIALIILILVAITFAYLYAQELSAHSQLQQAYSTLQLNATQLKDQISILKLQLASNKTLLSAISAELNATEYKLNATEYNLTHPLIQTLYDNKIVNIPPETVYYYPNGTGVYTPGQYNFSINVPYPGYINITETNTGQNNNATSAYFFIYASQEKPVMGGFGSTPNELGLSSFYSPFIRTGPANGATVTIPVLNGTTYLLFQNFNYNTGITVTFSIKYVGFRTH